MASTIKGWIEATHAAKGEEARRIAARVTSGTTTPSADLDVIWIGDHLALIAWPFGAKEVVLASDPRHGFGFNSAEAAALRRLYPEARSLPNRLTGYALVETLARLGRADEFWTAVVAEEQSRIDAEHGERTAQHARATADAQAKARYADAASDLLAALKRLLEVSETQGDDGLAPSGKRWANEAREAARVAIAKAEGR